MHQLEEVKSVTLVAGFPDLGESSGENDSTNGHHERGYEHAADLPRVGPNHRFQTTLEKQQTFLAISKNVYYYRGWHFKFVSGCKNIDTYAEYVLIYKADNKNKTLFLQNYVFKDDFKFKQ